MSLRAEALSVERDERRVLSEVDLRAEPGELLAICGPNGAGKSTLLQALLGLLPASGTMRWGERALDTLPPRERAQLLAYVPQRTQLVFGLRVAEVVAQGRYAHLGPFRGLSGLRERDAAICQTALRDCDAEDLADRPFTRLSAGEQQRVMLARALATEAPVLLVDEPTASLDVGHALDILQRLRDLAQGSTRAASATEAERGAPATSPARTSSAPLQKHAGRCVVCVLHRLDEVLRFADRVVLLHDGVVQASGEPETVFDDERLRQIYGVQRSTQPAPRFERVSPS